jgi:hypothetical protein
MNQTEEKVLFGSAEKVTGICSEEKNLNSGLTSGVSTTMPLCIMY